jgi:hypothetical protein
MKNLGHELLFLGGTPIQSQGLNAFSETFYEPITNSFRVSLEPSFKRRWLKRIDQIQPDVVHAHDIIAAAMMLDSDYPVVYDDHEYWSRELFKYSSRSFFRRMVSKPLARAIPKWERKVLIKYPVITVSGVIAEEHRLLSKFVGVTKNYPMLKEVENLKPCANGEGIVYIGGDFNLQKFLPHRDMSGLSDVIDFDRLSDLPHLEMMEKLTHYRFGLTPWKQHPFHKYCEPNKTYEYLHAGLQVIATDSLSNQFQDVKYIHSFIEYSQIPDLIGHLENYESEEIMNYARQKFIWENQEKIIQEAYQKALKL